MPGTSPSNHAQSDAGGGRAAVQEMLGAPPGWALRWGISAVFAAVVLLLIGAWLIRYPDTVTAEVVLTTPQPAIRIVAPRGGKLQRLMVKDGEIVQPGQTLAVLENPAVLEEVQTLQQWLEKDTLKSSVPDLRLGTLQAPAAQLQRNREAYQFFLRRSDWAKRIRSLRNQQEQLVALSAAQAQKLEVLQAERDLAQANFKRNEALAASGNVSQLDKEQAQLAVLRLEREIREVEAERLRNALEAERNNALLITLQQEQQNSAQDLKLACEESKANLKAAVETWQQNNLVRAEIAGRAAFHQPLSAGQYLEQGQLVMTVLPESGERDLVLARGYLPAQNAGRVDTGMQARLFLDAYPEQQYGALRAEVRHIAPIPEQQAYYIELALTAGLQTTYGQEVPFSQELSAHANIITEDRRLLFRLFDQLRSLWENY
ncbi:HlyD family secretion protein [Phaeodactylibacter xiamenensis]|uniref:HlyD family secretion protein n=1 Tax=Phaeodactylibacter xiamenensis TaxID=1524460 RepID=UPI0024A9B941|nr:HlyD family efflux transporter periplasmic adaptor subunit [Phaeodactylibacter xiamenensis]